jgi:hypothetical protein
VVLCGVRDLRDYRIHASSEAAPITGGSAFNIKAKSLRLGDFSAAEVATLLGEHTAETGQAFTAEALARVWELTQASPGWSMPWPTRAASRCRRGATAPPHRHRLIDQAKENLILRRVTHLDQLADKLREPRVRRVIEPMLAGTALGRCRRTTASTWSTSACCAHGDGGGLVTIANPIYREVCRAPGLHGPRTRCRRSAPPGSTPTAA